MATISNNNDNTIISGTNDADNITNFVSNVTIYGYGGNDTINSGGLVVYSGGVRTEVAHDSVSIDAGSGDDNIYYDGGNYVSIDVGDGNDRLYLEDDTYLVVNLGDGNDQVDSFNNDNVTITAGSGSDSIDFIGSNVIIDAGSDDDEISHYDDNYTAYYVRDDLANASYGNNVTINAGTGNDSVWAGTNDVITYAEGDGNDSIYGYYVDDTIQIDSSSTPSTVASGSDIIINIGTGSIRLVNATDTTITAINSSGDGINFSEGTANQTVTPADTDTSAVTSVWATVTNAEGTTVIDYDNNTATGTDNADTIQTDWISNTVRAVYANGGNDFISLTGNYYAMQFSTVTVDGGAGDDFLYIYGGTDGIHPSKVTITGGNGSDTIEIHGGIVEASEDKTAVSVDGGDGDDRIIIHADNEKGIDISNVTITGGAGNDLISIYGGTYGIGGVEESLNSVYGGTGEIAATVSISGGDGADTISVSAIDSISGGTVTITAGSGDVISVGSGAANYLFDSTDAVTINGATFTANAANTSASLESSADSTSIRSAWSGTVALSGQNSLADIDGSIVSAAGSYQVVDGRFTSFDTITPEPTSSITSDTASVSVQVVNAVDLNLVPEGQTGYFVAQINSDSASVTPIFKTESPAENDTLFGNVTANKIYYAENNHGGQTVTIPSSWNVTATENNDTLNVRGTNVTVTGGAGSDLFSLGEDAFNITFTDLTPSEDNLSFENYIQPGSMRQSFDDNHLVLSADNLRVDLPSMSEMTAEFLDYSVSNAGSSSTIRELLYVNSNSSSSYISFSHWTFGFENSSGF